MGLGQEAESALSEPPSVRIRHEDPEDFSAVFALNAAAFGGEVEAKLVEALRGTAEPLISLVADLDGRIVGHALFTPVEVETAPERTVPMALGPMAVAPEHQRRGIGALLVREGLRRCYSLGSDVVFVVGHPEYYPRFGFVSAAPRGLHYKGEEFDPYFMVLELREGALEGMTGEVRYRPEFDQA